MPARPALRALRFKPQQRGEVLTLRVVVTGAQGQLGHAVVEVALARGWQVLPASRDDFDLTDAAATQAWLRAAQPDAVVHCAAYTQVDKAETEPALAFAVNRDGTRAIAEFCAAQGVWLLFVSTDYVFDGSGTRPWEPEDVPAPLNLYGKSKLAGEQAVLQLCARAMVVRTSWVFAVGGCNFVHTMLRLGRERDHLRVVDDQVGCPTFAPDLAELLCAMVAAPQAGVYHAANATTLSWAGFAKAIFALAPLPCRVEPILSCDYPQAALRPKNSRLSPRALLAAGYAPLPPLALARILPAFLP